MADLEIAFRLPIPSWPRAVFEAPFGYRGGRLRIGDLTVLEACDRKNLEIGIAGELPDGEPVSLRLLVAESGERSIAVRVGDSDAVREDQLAAAPSRSAWTHAFMALLASAFGFAAGYLYLLEAQASGDPWPLKMARHMAGWHLLLTLTLFPASVWGQRLGIRIVQTVSAVFFAIHVGIAIANATAASATELWIAVFNAASGAFFLAAAIYGNRAHRDMDPLRGLPELAEARVR